MLILVFTSEHIAIYSEKYMIKRKHIFLIVWRLFFLVEWKSCFANIDLFFFFLVRTNDMFKATTPELVCQLFLHDSFNQKKSDQGDLCHTCCDLTHHRSIG